MDYEKKYKEALDWMQSLYNGLHGATKEDAERYFPELKESEDERIRKKLIKTIGYFRSRGIDQQLCEKFLAWLKKQSDYNRLVEEIKERKELLSKEKEKVKSINDKLSLGGRIAILEELLAFTNKKQGEKKSADSYCKENCKGFQETGRCFADEECKAKREAEQNSAWSEEDEQHCRYIIDFYLKEYYGATALAIEWLENLKYRVQSHWKPTNQQLGVLQTAMRDYGDGREYYIIESLYNDLKKL